MIFLPQKLQALMKASFYLNFPNSFQCLKCKWHQTIINTNHSYFLFVFFMLFLEYIEYVLYSVTVSDMYCVSYMLQLKFHIISVWQLCIMYYEKQATFYSALKMKNISEAICKWNKEHFFHFIIINNFGIHTENVLPIMPYS